MEACKFTYGVLRSSSTKKEKGKNSGSVINRPAQWCAKKEGWQVPCRGCGGLGKYGLGLGYRVRVSQLDAYYIPTGHCFSPFVGLYFLNRCWEESAIWVKHERAKIKSESNKRVGGTPSSRETTAWPA